MLSIFKDGKFTGHTGQKNNLIGIANVLKRKYPKSIVIIRPSKEQRHIRVITA